MTIVEKFKAMRRDHRVQMQMLRSVHPGYRRETRQEQENLQRYRPRIVQMVLDNNATDRWRIHALQGQTNRYHVTPDVGMTYLICLEDGSCTIEQSLSLSETCSPTP